MFAFFDKVGEKFSDPNHITKTVDLESRFTKEYLSIEAFKEKIFRVYPQLFQLGF